MLNYMESIKHKINAKYMPSCLETPFFWGFRSSTLSVTCMHIPWTRVPGGVQAKKLKN